MGSSGKKIALSEKIAKFWSASP